MKLIVTTTLFLTAGLLRGQPPTTTPVELRAQDQLTEAFCSCLAGMQQGPYRGTWKAYELCDNRLLSTGVPGFTRAEIELDRTASMGDHRALAWQVHDIVLSRAVRECDFPSDQPIPDTAAFMERMRQAKRTTDEFQRRPYE